MNDETSEPTVIELEAGDVRATIDLVHGARLTALQVGPHQLLAHVGTTAVEWGSFPMAPFAGRLGHGQLNVDGRSYQLPINAAPHALHGTVFDRRWHRLDGSSATIDLGSDWPFRGRATQRFDLHPDHLNIELTVTSGGDAFPAAAGFHPWFRRQLDGGGTVTIHNPARTMLVRGADGLPDGTTVSPIPPGPWDDCFTDVVEPIELTWPDALRLRLRSNADYWVIFDERHEGVCVEPQTSPPNRLDDVVDPSHPLVVTTSWSWGRLD